MLEQIKGAIIPYFAGLAVMCLGWYVTMVNTVTNIELARNTARSVYFTKETFLGLIIILLGAFLPGIYLRIMGKFSK